MIKNFTPLRDKVFVTELEHGLAKTLGGIILPDDNMKESGVRDRWAKVYKVGSDITDVKPGEWVLLKHGRWSERIKVEDDDGKEISIWFVEYPQSVLCAVDEDPRLRLDIATPDRVTHLTGF